MTRAPDGEASGEDRLIARCFGPIATHPAALGLEDDAAAWSGHSGDTVLTTDMLVAGVHFFPEDPPDAIARKALRVNLSDLAAKRAQPAGFLLSIAVPKGLEEGWLDVFSAGLAADASDFGCPLFGGDTTSTPGPLTLSITALGQVPSDGMLRRRGARAGDVVCVTGTIGDAALGLRLRLDASLAERTGLPPADRDYLFGRYLVPEPRLGARSALSIATAGMDVSDGLVGDLAKLCRVSGVGATIEWPRVPLSDAARRLVAADPSLIETVLGGGDDYEVLCTVPPDGVMGFVADCTAAGVPATTIGVIHEGRGVEVRDGAGGLIAVGRGSFSHF